MEAMATRLKQATRLQEELWLSEHVSLLNKSLRRLQRHEVRLQQQLEEHGQDEHGEDGERHLDQIDCLVGGRCHAHLLLQRIEQKMATLRVKERELALSPSFCAMPNTNKAQIVQVSKLDNDEHNGDDEDKEDNASKKNSTMDEAIERVYGEMRIFYEHQLSSITREAREIRKKYDDNYFNKARILANVYVGHKKSSDMFVHVVAKMDHNNRDRAQQVWHDLHKLKNLRQRYRATIEELLREKRTLDIQVKQARAEEVERRHREQRVLLDQQRQQRVCRRLRQQLQLLRQQQEQQAQVERIQLQEREADARLEQVRRAGREERRRQRVNQMVKTHKEKKERMEKQLKIEQSQKEMMERNRAREKALLNRLRVNFRHVMGEKRREEQLQRLQAENLAKAAREARLETLRKLSRRRTSIIAAKINNNNNNNNEDNNEDKEEKTAPCGSWLFPLYSFTDDQLMRDARLVVEQLLRNNNLLSKEASLKIARQIAPPTKPRMDALISQITLF